MTNCRLKRVLKMNEPKLNNIKIPNEIWCRTCGYYRPIKQMSAGKQSEFNDRINYKLPEGLNG